MPEPSNDEIADELERFGRRLEIAGENPFRSRAYSKAAEALRHTDEPASSLARAGRLGEISGIGVGIAASIVEFLESGRLPGDRELDDLVPSGALELLSVPGVGAKTAQRLVRELRIADLDALEAAARSGRLVESGIFGAKAQDRLLTGVAEVRRRTGRIPLGSALPLGRQLVDTITSLAPGAEVSLTGSLRRMEETVGNIDVLVGVADASSALHLVASALSDAVPANGDAIELTLGRRQSARVMVVASDRFGTELVRTTGPAAHLERLSSDLPIASDERDVYGGLGLAWIPPELRQGRDEVELAAKGALPQLVTVDHIKGEFHCHSTWSDGAGSIEDMVSAAKLRGYVFLGISDHSQSLGVAGGLDAERLRRQRDEITRAQRTTGIRVFAGIEAEVDREGNVDLGDKTLAELDVVIASTHSGLRQNRDEITRRLLRVIANPNVDIIAHPSGRLIERREGGDFDWDEIFPAAAAAGTVLEINADPARLDLNGDLARQAIAAGCTLTINCDAHRADGFGLLEYGIAMARRAGATPTNILNCRPLDEIEAWLSDRRAPTSS